MNLIKLMFSLFVQLFKYIFNYENYDNTIIKCLNHIGNYNIIFIKIFQWIWIKNNNPDNSWLTETISKELYTYTNNTPYNESDIDYKNLINIFMIAQKRGDNLELLDIIPCNSGTISLIFKAKLNNKNIVIKLLRNNIKKKLEDGVNLLINIEKILYNTIFFNKIVTTKIFDNNKANILSQVDLLNEVANMNLFNKSFLKCPDIIVPNVYSSYTEINSNFILMDYIDGKYIYELTNEELDKYFDTFIKFIMNFIFIKNILHCDLHQGNILFYKETTEENNQLYKIGIIDMGMITKINVRELNFMYLWLMAIYNDKFEYFLDYLKDPKNYLHLYEQTTNIIECIDHVQSLYEKKELFQESNTKKIVNDVYKFLTILKQYNCRLASRYNFFILSLIPILTLIVNLGPNIEKKYMVKDYLEKMSNNDLLD